MEANVSLYSVSPDLLYENNVYLNIRFIFVHRPFNFECVNR